MSELQRRRFPFFLSAAVLSAALLFCPSDATAQSLGETVARAVETHPDIRAGQAARAGLEETAKERLSGFFPVLGAEAAVKAMHTDNDTTRAATGGSASGYSGEGMLRLSQMIYDGSNTANSYRAARERAEAGGFEIENKALDIASSAVRAHLSVLRMQELENLTADYIRDIDGFKARILDLVEAGAADEAQLLQAREILAMAGNARLDYRERGQLARVEYRQLTGEFPGAVLELSEADRRAAGAVPATAEAALDAALQHHPQLVSTQRNLQALDYEIRAEEGKIMPRLDAELSYLNRDQKEDFGGEVEDAAAMLRLKWDFSFGGAHQARVGKKRQARHEAEMRRRSTLRDLERRVLQSHARFETARDRLDLAQQRSETNRGILVNYRDQFEGGTRTILQLLQARSQSYQADVAYLQARYGLYQAQYEVLGAMGILSEALGGGKVRTADGRE